MKRLFGIVMIIVALYAIFNISQVLSKKDSVTEMFEREGGVVAYKVDREYVSDYYMIIDFNNFVTYSFGGSLKHVFIDEISNIKDDSFQVGGRKYIAYPSQGLNSISSKSIKFSRSNSLNSLSRVDLSEAQRLADMWRESYGEEDRR